MGQMLIATYIIVDIRPIKTEVGHIDFNFITHLKVKGSTIAQTSGISKCWKNKNFFLNHFIIGTNSWIILLLVKYYME